MAFRGVTRAHRLYVCHTRLVLKPNLKAMNILYSRVYCTKNDPSIADDYYGILEHPPSPSQTFQESPRMESKVNIRKQAQKSTRSVNNEAGNLFDQQYFQYFPEFSKRTESQQSNYKTRNARKLSPEISNRSSGKNFHVDRSEMNYFDETLFESYKSQSQYSNPKLARDNAENIENVKKRSELPSDLNYFDELLLDSYGNAQKETSEDATIKTSSKTIEGQSEESETALDVVQRLRRERQQGRMNSQNKNQTKQEEVKISKAPSLVKWEGKVDSQGFKILESQKPNLDHMMRVELVQMLKRAIIYEDDEVLAIDKPYGLASHGGPGVNASVGQLLGDLQEAVSRTNQPIENLYLVHRLDKETTGVMVLAKSLASYHKLQQRFVERTVVKKYWVITRGIPNPSEGVIDIPIAEATVTGKHRMALRPQYPAEMRQMVQLSAAARCRSAADAITNFKIIHSHGSAALVECQPETGLKHQIRCHLAFGLNTPILGDHKYSHLSKIAPQRLFPDMLQRLGIRQSKVRHVPLHLHAKVLVMPEYRDGRNLFITAPLPSFFRQNMRWLKLKVPR